MTLTNINIFPSSDKNSNNNNNNDNNIIIIILEFFQSKVIVFLIEMKCYSNNFLIETKWFFNRKEL